MSLCEHCTRATFNGYPPDGSPEWEVGTVYFWCPEWEDHRRRERCRHYESGAPRRYDKRGKEMR